MTKIKKQYLGIDLGTSAVKVLLVDTNGDTVRAKCRYDTADTDGWCVALQTALRILEKQTSLAGVSAIALSSQVGTYITDTGEVLGWDSAVGREELQEIKTAVDTDAWVHEIGMVHPDIISYPLPRLLYIKRHLPQCTAVMMPKELLVKELTGKADSDVFSWRGLCHPDKKVYSEALLAQFGIDLTLPNLLLPTDLVGTVTKTASRKYGIPVDVPVYVGCNDFFAGLLGMGVWDEGTIFELSGTSEHLGVVTAERKDGGFVSGKFFNGYTTYGGTKASGVSCDFAMRQFGLEGVEASIAHREPPIFLPYLKGERAPIYDENAKGVFFGITDKTTNEDMAYAVLEGVVFSLYHIGEKLDIKDVPAMVTGGGSALDAVMAKLKATLFNCDIFCVTENDSSALGAALLAMVGDGAFSTLGDAIKAVVSATCVATPDAALREPLLKRYAIYKNLYKSLKDQFEAFSKLKGADK